MKLFDPYDYTWELLRIFANGRSSLTLLIIGPLLIELALDIYGVGKNLADFSNGSQLLVCLLF